MRRVGYFHFYGRLLAVVASCGWCVHHNSYHGHRDGGGIPTPILAYTYQNVAGRRTRSGEGVTLWSSRSRNHMEPNQPPPSAAAAKGGTTQSVRRGVLFSRTRQSMSLSSLPRRMMNHQQNQQQRQTNKRADRLSRLQALALLEDPFGINAILHPNLQQALALGFAAFCFAQTKNAWDEQRQAAENRRRARLNKYNNENNSNNKYQLPPRESAAVPSNRASRIQDQLMLLERWKEEANIKGKTPDQEMTMPWPDLTVTESSSSSSLYFVSNSEPPALAPALANNDGHMEENVMDHGSDYSISQRSPDSGSASNGYYGGTTGNSFYRNAESWGSTSQRSEYAAVAPAPAVIPEMPQYSSPPSFDESKQSYSVSTWSPGSTTTSTSNSGTYDNSYLENVGAAAVLPTSDTWAPTTLESAAPLYTAAALEERGGAKKSYAVSKWSPSSGTQETGSASGTTGSTRSYLENMSTSAFPTEPSSQYTVIPDPLPPPPAPVVVSVVPPPAPFGSYSGSPPSPASNDDYLMLLSGAKRQRTKKSYKMSKWTPKSRVNNAASAGSSTAYLFNMNLPRPYVAPSYSDTMPPTPPAPVEIVAAAKPAPATVSPPFPATAPAYTSSSYYAGAPAAASSGSSTAVPKKGYYTMTKWTPSSGLSYVGIGGSSSYLANMSSSSSSTQCNGSSIATPSYAIPGESPASVPLPPSATPAVVPEPVVASRGSSKKSYSMSQWSPGSGVVGSVGSSYLSNLSSSVGDSTALSGNLAPPPAPAVPAFTTATTPYTTVAESNDNSAPKKSYSMSKWSPGSSVKGTVGSSSSYLNNMSSGDPQSYGPPSYSVPAVPASSSPTPTPAYSTAAASTNASAAKKSYSMSKWSPNSGSQNNAGNAYLNHMSGGTSATSVPAISKTESPIHSMPPPAAISASGEPKKSYSMSKWSPGWSAQMTGTAGSGNSYLSTMSASGGGIKSEIESLINVMPSPTVTKDSGEPKKSYSMSKWNPESSTPMTGTVGSGISYLSTMSSLGDGPNSEIESLINVMPSPTVTRDSGEPKKSYSMSKWNPRYSTPMTGTFGSGNSYLSTMSSSGGGTESPMNSVPPAAVPATAPAADTMMPSLKICTPFNCASITNGTPKKSYSVSKWNPGSGTGGSGNAYLSNRMSNDNTPTLFSSHPTFPSSPGDDADPSLEKSLRANGSAAADKRSFPEKTAMRQNFTPFGRRPIGSSSPGVRSSYLENLKER